MESLKIHALPPASDILDKEIITDTGTKTYKKKHWD